MPKGHLLDSQVLDIEKAVELAGLPPTDFQWMGQDGGWAGSYHEPESEELVSLDNVLFDVLQQGTQEVAMRARITGSPGISVS